MTKRQVFWVSDSYGRESVHLNGPSFSFESSYLGHLEPVGDGTWLFVPAGKIAVAPHGPYDSYAEAKRTAMKVLDAEYVG
jgi:hypothetical protein